MPDYMNAGSYDPLNNGQPPAWMRGGLAGFTAGQNRGIQGDILSRQFAAQDLEQQGKQLAYQEMLDNAPLRKAQSEEKMAGLEDQKKLRDAGADDASERIRKHIQGLDDDQLKKVKNMAERQEQAGKFAQQIDGAIGDSATIPPHLKPQIDAMIEAQGLPKLPDDPVEARAAIKRAAEGYNKSGIRLEHAQKLASEEERARIAATSRQTVAETKADNALDVADVRNTGAAARAAATAGAKAAPSPKIGATEEAVMAEIAQKGPDAFLNPDGTINQGKLAIYEERLLKKDPVVAKDLQAKLESIDQSDASPAEKEKLKDQQRLRLLGTPWKLVMEARAKAAGQGTPKAQGITPEIINKAKSLPEGGTIPIGPYTYKKQGNKLIKVQ